MEGKMQTEEQKNYLSAKELVELGVDNLETTTLFNSSLSKPKEEVDFQNLGIDFKSGEFYVKKSAVS